MLGALVWEVNSMFQVRISECTNAIERELLPHVYNALAGTRSFKHRETVNITEIK